MAGVWMQGRLGTQPAAGSSPDGLISASPNPLLASDGETTRPTRWPKGGGNPASASPRMAAFVSNTYPWVQPSGQPERSGVAFGDPPFLGMPLVDMRPKGGDTVMPLSNPGQIHANMGYGNRG